MDGDPQYVLVPEEETPALAAEDDQEQDEASTGRSVWTLSDSVALLRNFLGEKARIRMADANHPKGKVFYDDLTRKVHEEGFCLGRTSAQIKKKISNLRSEYKALNMAHGRSGTIFIF